MNAMMWKRTGLGCAADGGKRTIVTAEQVREIAAVEGASKRLIESRIGKAVAFGTTVATYEPLKPGNHCTGILGYDGSWASR